MYTCSLRKYILEMKYKTAVTLLAFNSGEKSGPASIPIHDQVKVIERAWQIIYLESSCLSRVIGIFFYIKNIFNFNQHFVNKYFFIKKSLYCISNSLIALSAKMSSMKTL